MTTRNGNGTPRFRMTPQRRAVFEALRESGDHPSALALFERARLRYPRISYATIYNALNALVAAGMVKQIAIGDAARYDHRTDPHGHAVCSVCGALVDLDVSGPIAAAVGVAAAQGFVAEEIDVHVRGHCAGCRS